MESYLNAEISESAIRANFGLLRGLLAPGCKLCSVVKADCYGHGLATLLGLLEGVGRARWPPRRAIRLATHYQRPVLSFLRRAAPTGEAPARPSTKPSPATSP